MTELMSRRVFLVAMALAACTQHTDDPPSSEPPPTNEVEEVVFAPIDAELTWVRPNTCTDASPMTLTAADGTGLRLESLEANAVVDGPLAFTELRLAFVNPEPRQLEGRFSIQLPPGAAISRFAMKLENRWQEGEVVERKAARRAYEDFLHRRQDPALLENDAGNVFRARVFPIPANGTKELILSYSQELGRADTPYRIPLCGLPELGTLDVDVVVRRGASAMKTSLGGSAAEVRHIELEKKDVAPTMDLELRTGDGGPDGLRHGDLAVARITPVLDVAAPPMEELTIIFDTSASRALNFEGQLDRLQQLIAELRSRTGEALELTVVAADQTTETIYRGKAKGFGSTQVAKLRERGALGASDLAGAFDDLRKRGQLSARVLLISDGVATAGETDPAKLKAIAAGLRDAGVQRLDALIDGGIQDLDQLKGLATAGLSEDGIVVDARIEIATIAQRLLLATQSGIQVEVPGSEWVWPKTLDGVQPGDQVLVYAQLPDGQPMEVKLGGANVSQTHPKMAVAAAPLLQRSHASARIASLTARKDSTDNPARRKELVEQIIDLSTRHRVMSNYTALLVLETEQDYERYGIARRGLADIMTVGRSGIEVIKRAKPEEPEKTPERWRGEDTDKRKAPKAKGKSGNKDVKRDDIADNDARPTIDFDDDSLEGEVMDGQDGGGDVEKKLEEVSEEVAPRLEAPPAATPVPEPEPEPAADEARPTGQRVRSRISRAPSRRPPPAETGGTAAARPEKADPWRGRFRTVMDAIKRGDKAGAAREAKAWQGENPGDVLALVALGEVAESSGDLVKAARVYGSIIDLFPSRADLRRMAGERLERLDAAGSDLAIDTYGKAVEQRPDHPSSHRLYAFALAKAGRYAEAFEVINKALQLSYPHGRLDRTRTALQEDLGVLGQVIISRDPKRRKEIEAIVKGRGHSLESAPSLRFILVWETDANDVDFHIYDGKGGHAFYSSRTLPSGGTLFDDVTNGYGPEQFAIDNPKAFPYTLQAHYYSRGPMGYGMGSLEVMEHDGKGELHFSSEPFVIMVDSAYIDLGKITQLPSTKTTK